MPDPQETETPKTTIPDPPIKTGSFLTKAAPLVSTPEPVEQKPCEPPA